VDMELKEEVKMNHLTLEKKILKTYAFISSQELDFDYSVVCYSGCGIITPGNRMQQRYTKINYFMNDLEWNFNEIEENKADIIVINLPQRYE